MQYSLLCSFPRDAHTLRTPAESFCRNTLFYLVTDMNMCVLQSCYIAQYTQLHVLSLITHVTVCIGLHVANLSTCKITCNSTVMQGHNRMHNICINLYCYSTYSVNCYVYIGYIFVINIVLQV